MTIADRWLLPDGVEELLPAQAAQAEMLRRRLLDLYRSWGYELVMPPLLEFTESLLVGLGSDVDLHTFKLTDQISGRTMGVRADITSQAARIDAHSLRREGARHRLHSDHVKYKPSIGAGIGCAVARVRRSHSPVRETKRGRCFYYWSRDQGRGHCRTTSRGAYGGYRIVFRK